jgi:hypothetical protein
MAEEQKTLGLGLIEKTALASLASQQKEIMDTLGQIQIEYNRVNTEMSEVTKQIFTNNNIEFGSVHNPVLTDDYTSINYVTVTDDNAEVTETKPTKAKKAKTKTADGGTY